MLQKKYIYIDAFFFSQWIAVYTYITLLFIMEKATPTEPYQGYPGIGSAPGSSCSTLCHDGPLYMELLNSKTKDVNISKNI